MVERARSPRGRRPAQARPWSALGGVIAAVAVVAVAVLLAPASLSAQGASAPPGTVTDLAAQGQALFSQSCASCHGMTGTGTSLGPDISEAGPALADFVLRTGRMPPAGPGTQMQRSEVRFSDSQIQALVAYVSSLGTGGAPIPSVVIQGADVAAGRTLYVANCAACHGPASGGGAVGGGFVAPPLAQADPREIGEAVLSGPGQMPRFSFTPEQLDALAGYVTYLQTAPHPGGVTSPVVGPVTEGFVAGVALVVLLVIARWIGVRQRDRAKS
jgi:ubiquinol-cytochrome c reductase cytochrome c subunit